MPSRLHALALATVTALLPAAAAAGQHEHGAATGRTPAAKAAPASLKPAVGPLPPLPRVGYAPARPMAVVQQVFEFAARHPEVLAYMPCYCGCEQLGHQGNHDCFVKRRAPNGSIAEWEAHGIGCAICIDVGREAMMLFNTGASVSSIRAAIEKKYGGFFPSSTPTPKPPPAPAGKPAGTAKKVAPSR